MKQQKMPKDTMPSPVKRNFDFGEMLDKYRQFKSQRNEFDAKDSNSAAGDTVKYWSETGDKDFKNYWRQVLKDLIGRSKKRKGRSKKLDD